MKARISLYLLPQSSFSLQESMNVLFALHASWSTGKALRPIAWRTTARRTAREARGDVRLHARMHARLHAVARRNLSSRNRELAN